MENATIVTGKKGAQLCEIGTELAVARPCKMHYNFQKGNKQPILRVRCEKRRQMVFVMLNFTQLRKLDQENILDRHEIRDFLESLSFDWTKFLNFAFKVNACDLKSFVWTLDIQVELKRYLDEENLVLRKGLKMITEEFPELKTKLENVDNWESVFCEFECWFKNDCPTELVAQAKQKLMKSLGRKVMFLENGAFEVLLESLLAAPRDKLSSSICCYRNKAEGRTEVSGDLELDASLQQRAPQPNTPAIEEDPRQVQIERRSIMAPPSAEIFTNLPSLTL